MPDVVKFHEYANIFPMMSAVEFDALKSDMLEHGYRKGSPIVLLDGKILDGRNRYNAAQELGVKAEYIKFNGGGNPLDFVISSNLHRRHLSESQRAAIAAELANMTKADAGKRGSAATANLQLPKDGKVTQTDSAKMLNVSPRMVAAAKKVQHKSKKLFDQVKTGKITVNKAIKEIDRAKRDAARKRDAKRGAKAVTPDNVILLHGDFLECMATLPDNSVDLIFTDPPYDESHVVCYGQLAKEAARVLRVGGSLVAYAGHYALPSILNDMGQYMRYWWMIALKHGGASARLPGKWVIVEWKPLVWFVKENLKNFGYTIDLFESKPPTKNEHDWQQDTSEAEYYIRQLSSEGGLVVDPFVGSGTTLIAARNIGRVAWGCDSDIDRLNVARKRIADAVTVYAEG